MRHGHPPGWAPAEIGLFIDSHCRGATPLPVLGTPKEEGEQIRVSWTGQTSLKQAVLHYTTDSGLRSARQWKSIPATIEDQTIAAALPPAEANTWFVSATDERDAMVSSTVVFK
jgi:hypothetical protein